MLFADALKDLMNGKNACRSIWKTEGKYVTLMPGMPSIWMILTQPNPNANNWLPLADDLAADDWKVVERAEFKSLVPETAVAA